MSIIWDGIEIEGTYSIEGRGQVYCRYAPIIISLAVVYRSIFVQRCPRPINFIQIDPGIDIGNGVLKFQYAWGSSTGDVADLVDCTVGEIVESPGGHPYEWKTPPYAPTLEANPIIRNHPGTWGGFKDEHGNRGFQRPYDWFEFTQTQYFRYRCPCWNAGNYVNVMGPLTIRRIINQNPGGSYYYTVTKRGDTATYNPLP